MLHLADIYFSRILIAEILPLPVRICQIFPFGSYAGSERKWTGNPAPRILGLHKSSSKVSSQHIRALALEMKDYWTVINQTSKVPPRSENRCSTMHFWKQGRPFPAPLPIKRGAQDFFFLMTETQHFQESGDNSMPWLFYKPFLTPFFDFSTTIPCLCVCVFMHAHTASSPSKISFYFLTCITNHVTVYSHEFIHGLEQYAEKTP